MITTNRLQNHLLYVLLILLTFLKNSLVICFFFYLQAKGFHDHHKPSTKSSATSLKRKGNAKRSNSSSGFGGKQTNQSINLPYKVYVCNVLTYQVIFYCPEFWKFDVTSSPSNKCSKDGNI